MAECVHHNDTMQKVGEFAARLKNLETQAESLAARFNNTSESEIRNTTEIDHLKEEFSDLKDEYELNKDLIDQCQTVTGSLASQFEALGETVKKVTNLYDSKVNVSDFNNFRSNIEKDFGIIKERLAEKATKDSMESWKWVIVALGCGILGAAAKSLF